MTTFTLKLDSEGISPSAVNYVARSLHPKDDFPISLNPDGSVLSAYGSPYWDLSPYSDRPIRLRFGDSQANSMSLVLDQENASLYRRITFYYLYGPRPMITTRTVDAYHRTIGPMLKFCAEKGIPASDLHRYPKVYRAFAKGVSSGQGRILLLVLRELAQWPELLGFQVLRPDQVEEMAKLLPVHQSSQYPYIPQRIYAHLISRCHSMLSDYLEHQEGFEQLFHRCLNSYVRAYGSIDAFNDLKSRWRSNPTAGRRSPFSYMVRHGGSSGEYRYFHEMASDVGVVKVMERWLLDDGRSLRDAHVGIFSRYLSGVCFVGQVYLATFSGMRVNETNVIRANCFETDDDPVFGRAYLLRGETSKTEDDDAALWVTSPSAEMAVRAMASVSRLRLEAARLDSRSPVRQTDLANPRLVTRAYEPWSASKEPWADVDRAILPSLGDWKKRLHTLFDRTQLAITSEDMELAQRMTPSIDTTKFAVGKTWELSFHQLRRTLACNAVASDLVSIPALSRQLKHATLAQTWHYGNNYSSLKLNQSVKKAYDEALIDTLIARSDELNGDEFISPLGQKNKERQLQLITVPELQQLKLLAKKGRISIRETALGVCMRRDACPYGGWEHIAECVCCDEAFIDKRKRPAFERIHDDISRELAITSERDAAKREALESQMKAAQRALELTLVC